MHDEYRITTVLMVETDIFDNFAASPKWLDVIGTSDNVCRYLYIGNVTMCLKSYGQKIFTIRVNSRWYWWYHYERSKDKCPILPI